MTPPEHNLKGHPEIFVVGNALKEDGTPLGLRGAGMGFHTDGEDKPVPNAGSFLYALQVPPEEGDTIFADLYAAYEALPAETRARIAGRRARFSRAALHHVNYRICRCRPNCAADSMCTIRSPGATTKATAPPFRSAAGPAT